MTVPGPFNTPAPREGESWLELAARTTGAGLFEWDLRAKQVHFSREWTRQLGHDEGDVGTGLDEWHGRIHPDDREDALAQLHSFLAGDGRERGVALRMQHRDGTYRWMQCRWTLLRVDGAPVRLIGSHVDITETREALEETRKLAMAVQQSPASIVVTDTNGDIEYVNEKFLEVTGYAADEVIGQNPRVLKSGETSAEEYRGLWDAISSGHGWRGTFHNRRKDGSLFWEQAAIWPIRDVNGTTTHYIAIKEDITGQRELEAQLHQAQKMEAVGRLAGGIAHDFNNLLSVILSCSEFALEHLGDDDPVREDLREIVRAGERAAALTRQLLAFSRRQVLQPRVIDVNEIVAAMHGLLQRAVGEGVDLKLQLVGETLHVKADRGQVEQVLMNLAVNARDAMPSGGQLVIETRRQEPSDAVPEPSATGSHAEIVVTDSGEGMDESVRRQCFEPFFTTKPEGHGTGLGLSTVYGIVEQSGGSIEVASTPGHGASFTVRLPSAPADERPGGAPSAVGRLPVGHETILLVEDDAAVRSAAARILRAAGYQVDAVSTAAAAIEACQRIEGPVHLVITDIVMPRMSGLELARKVRPLRPESRILFITGYAPDESLLEQALAAGGEILTKPFDSALARRVRELLDRRR